MIADGGPDAMFVAGGTDLYPNMKRRQQVPKIVIGLAQLGELRTIKGDPSEGSPGKPPPPGPEPEKIPIKKQIEDAQKNMKIAEDKNLFEKGWRPLWVVDFPMFEWDEEGKRWSAMHHPFTAPRDGHEDAIASDPGHALAKAYDMVLNGWEIGGGSIRIHRAEVQAKVFRALGISDAEAKERFGFLLEAFRYGAPPHGGVALGFDRMVMLMARADSLREVIAFPKTARAQDLLSEAPSRVDEKQLDELGIALKRQS